VGLVATNGRLLARPHRGQCGAQGTFPNAGPGDVSQSPLTIRSVAAHHVEDGRALAEAKAAEINGLTWDQLDAYGQRIERVTLPSGKAFRVKSVTFWDMDDWESDLHISVAVYAESGWRRFWPYKARGFRGGETMPERP
jgi:hypothetical protein